MISFAQNGEDVLLSRVFAGQATGSYVDVGAGHPWVDSVTCHFYLQGWRGLNVEPRPSIAQLLRQWRPQDMLEECGISDHEGEMTFFEINAEGGSCQDGGGLSTFDASVVEELSQGGFSIIRHQKRVITLAQLLAEHNIGTIDFLKVDVEGHEPQVIKGNDWRRWRPRVVVVEAITPIKHTDQTGPWKSYLINQGYIDAAFDGINRYFVREEDKQLAEILAVPVNILDGFTTWQSHLHQTYLKRKLRSRYGAVMATNCNVPLGLQPARRPKSFLRRLV